MMENSSLSVLFVEDDPVAADRLSSLLQRESLRVHRAVDGLDGVSAFRSRNPDVVITDIRMPRMSGIEMAREIRKLDPEVPIIMTSAYNETEYFMNAIDIGIDHYILKPVDGQVLLRAIRKCGERKFLADARIQAEEALRVANETLEQKVRARTAELETALATVTAAQREWQVTFDSISDQIAIVDRDYRVVRSNRAFAALTGAGGVKEAKGKCYNLFCDPTVLEDGFCPHTRTLADFSMHVEEIRRKQDGRLFRVSTFPYRSPAGDVIGSIHVSRDITDVKEQELSMIMNERLAVLGQMVAGLAHELKNPLATMSGCSELLEERIKAEVLDRKQMATLISIVSSEVSRSNKIIDTMLSPVKKRSLEAGEIQLAPLMDKTVDLIDYQGRLRNVDVDRKYREDTPPVFASEGELQQVFLILLTNALDAMADFGRLSIETRAEAGGAVVEIADSGPGIPHQNVPRIFNAFFTTKSEAGGTGLGLSIAARIVSTLGGSLSVASTGPEGTRFRISLPRSTGEPPEQSETDERQPGAPERGSA